MRPAQAGLDNFMGGEKMRKYLLSAAAVMSVVAVSTTVLADEASAKKMD